MTGVLGSPSATTTLDGTPATPKVVAQRCLRPRSGCSHQPAVGLPQFANAPPASHPLETPDRLWNARPGEPRAKLIPACFVEFDR